MNKLHGVRHLRKISQSDHGAQVKLQYVKYQVENAPLYGPNIPISGLLLSLVQDVVYLALCSTVLI